MKRRRQKRKDACLSPHRPVEVWNITKPLSTKKMSTPATSGNSLKGMAVPFVAWNSNIPCPSITLSAA